ncbi:MAG: hypothetical protein ABIK44_07925 [candidate division WOR-3 bacterium]
MSSRKKGLEGSKVRGLIAAGCWLLLCACSDTTLYRAGRDYFPLIPGSEWRYQFGTDTTYLSVDSSQQVIQGQTCTVLYRNFAPEYWTKGLTEVRKFFVLASGYGETLEARFGLVYQLPLVLGSVWQDEFFDTLLVRGDTIYFSHSLAGRVAAIEAVSTLAGTFYDCYRLDFQEQVVDPETTTTQFTEWLAPGVGVVKRQTSAGDELLIEYKR